MKSSAYIISIEQLMLLTSVSLKKHLHISSLCGFHLAPRLISYVYSKHTLTEAITRHSYLQECLINKNVYLFISAFKTVVEHNIMEIKLSI